MARYALFKARMDGGEGGKLSAGQHLLASAESGQSGPLAPQRLRHSMVAIAYTSFVAAGIVTAVMTNPIWVVKTRMFTSRADDPKAYKNVFRQSDPPSVHPPHA